MSFNSASRVSVFVASAAGLPFIDSAAAQMPPFAGPGVTTLTFEGGVSFSNLGTSSVGAVPYIPQTTFFGTPGPVTSSGNPDFGDSKGGWGSFSVARNIDAISDWRFSAGFNVFGTRQQSGSASQDFDALPVFFATNSASVTERDRFALYTADFDFGRNWSYGNVYFRAFSGLRGLYTNDRFDRSIHTDGTDKVGFFNVVNTVTDSLSRGRSNFYGVGPRVGVDVFAGSVFGVVGHLSAALLGGQKDSNVFTTNAISLDGGAATTSTTQISRNEFDWVANVSGSIGAAWQFAPGGQLVIGYKLDQWYNIRETFGFFGLNRKEDVLVQTPFIRATMRF